jgi:hypothetical protein
MVKKSTVENLSIISQENFIPDSLYRPFGCSVSMLHPKILLPSIIDLSLSSVEIDKG